MGEDMTGATGYESPALIVLGSIEELTYGQKTGPQDDGFTSYCPTC
jgi:hypothetical protein